MTRAPVMTDTRSSTGPGLAALSGSTMKRETVLEGQVRVSADPECELSTVLGSCVAACLYDPQARIGGMNHFLLGEPLTPASGNRVDEHYGVYLMEVLINEMLKLGACRTGMKAHLYGGAQLRDSLGPIGLANAAFAKRFLETERIVLVRSDLGGNQARRVGFRPASGQVRLVVTGAESAPVPKPASSAGRAGGDVEFF